MATLDELLDAGDRQRDRTHDAGRVAAGYLRIGAWSVGWLLARLFVLLLGAVAGLFFVIGWACGRAVPMLKWARTAFVLGWEAGRPPGGDRGTA